jgi:hypothetical protein
MAGPNLTEEDIVEMFTYHAPTPEQRVALIEVRAAAQVFCQTLAVQVPASADRSAAIRKLRECVMTANAAIVLHGKF